MFLITEQLESIINKIVLPKELIDIIKEYAFYEYAFHKIKKIPRNDIRYDLLLTISIPIYDPEDGSYDVDLSITKEKWYYLVYINNTLQIQTLTYEPENNRISLIDCCIIEIQ